MVPTVSAHGFEAVYAAGRRPPHPVTPDGRRSRPRHQPGDQGDARGLHPALRAAQLPPLVPHGRGHDGARGHRLHGRLLHRRRHRSRPRHRERARGDLRRRSRHLRHRLPAGVLRSPVQHRPGPDHPRLRLRLLRLGTHQRHLRQLHLHLLRPRRLDHGAGAEAGPRSSAVAGVPGLHADGDPTGDLRHEGTQQAPGVDDAGLAGADGRPAGLPRHHRPRHGRPLPLLRRHGRHRRRQHRLGPARRGRVPVAHRADRRADRLLALHAAQDRGQQAHVVDRSGHGRPGLGGARRAEAGHRRVPRRLHSRRGRSGGPRPNPSSSSAAPSTR
ncbi:hypothetical protein RKD48_007906 [Streptomyces ambofaciens]